MRKKNQIPILLANKRIIKSMTSVLVLIINLGFTGCLTYMIATHDPPPSNLDQIKEGVDRKTVESVLGKPKQKNANVYTYEYNTYKAPALWGAILFDVMTWGMSAIYYGDFKKGEKADKTRMKIIFSPSDTVVSLKYALAESNYFRWINSANRNEEIKLLCVSANSGYAHAQAIQAMMYRYGLWNTEIDNVKAYRWLKLADFGGQHNAQEVMTAWTKNMTSEEMEEAEKSFREWEPASCEK
jgi:hypothetical protein